MNKFQLFFFACICLLAGTSKAQNTAFGFGENATGGGNASPTLVGSVSELTTALKKSGNGVIIITKNLTFTSCQEVKASNKTLLALPGVKLISAKQDQSNSGILIFKSGSTNLILRNLTFEGPGAYDCDGKDLLCFDGVTNAWVDHCDFADGCDGNFDNKGKTDNITISWCRFHYNKPPKKGGSGGSDDHRYSNLIGANSSDKPADGTYNMTWAYCWWDNGCVERMTRARNAYLHFLNCYWNSNSAKYYIGPENVKAYIEGCSFVMSNQSKIFYENYGGTNACKFVASKGSNGLPSDKGTVSAPTYKYTALTYSEAVAKITDTSCGAGATLIVTNTGAVSSSCDEPAPEAEPTLTVTGAQNQTITEGSAISNIVFTASGTATSIQASNLPAGLTAKKSGLVLTISGTPTASGTYTVTATNAGGKSTTQTGTITLKTPAVAPVGDMCIDLTKGEEPSISNGGIPTNWSSVGVTVNNTKSSWSKTEGFKMGGNADYIVVDFTAYTNICINSISFDVTIPNWTDEKNTIGYRYTTDGTNNTATIASKNTETVVLTPPADAKMLIIQRTAGTGTNIKSICFTFTNIASDIKTQVQNNIQFVQNQLLNPNCVRLQVFNLAGQLLHTANGNVDMKHYSKGIYIVRSENGEMLKIVKH